MAAENFDACIVVQLSGRAVEDDAPFAQGDDAVPELAGQFQLMKAAQQGRTPLS